MRCTAKWCRFKTEARKGTPLYYALFSETPPTMELDVEQIEQEILEHVGKILRTEYPGLTLEQLGTLQKSFPTLSMEHIRGRKG